MVYNKAKKLKHSTYWHKCVSTAYPPTDFWYNGNLWHLNEKRDTFCMGGYPYCPLKYTKQIEKSETHSQYNVITHDNRQPTVSRIT